MNREEWLTKAVDIMRPMLAERARVEVPSVVHVSVGWPGGKSVRKVIGQCWPTRSGDGVPHVFISPRLVDPVAVLATLAHELIHAALDCEHGHGAPFGRAARAFGLTGKMTATEATPELAEELRTVADAIGEYPHRAITLDVKMPKQTTRMIKVVCDDDGYTLRTTRQWIEVGLPSCPCGAEMVVAS